MDATRARASHPLSSTTIPFSESRGSRDHARYRLAARGGVYMFGVYIDYAYNLTRLSIIGITMRRLTIYTSRCAYSITVYRIMEGTRGDFARAMRAAWLASYRIREREIERERALALSLHYRRVSAFTAELSNAVPILSPRPPPPCARPSSRKILYNR